MKRTRPRTSTNAKTIQATARREMKRLIEKAKKGGENADQYIAESLQTPQGRRAFPALAQQVRATADVQLLVTNVAATIESAGRHSKIQLVKSVTSGLTGIYCEEVLGISPSQRKRAALKQALPAPMFTDKYSPEITRKKNEHLDSIAMAFFIDTTSQNSGCQSKTRNLEIQTHEWKAEWYARYPKLCRDLIWENRNLVTEHQGDKNIGTLTKFQANCRTADWKEKQSGFSPSVEYEERYGACMEEYLTALAVKNGHIVKTKCEPITDDQRKQEKLIKKEFMKQANFDPSKYKIKVPDFDHMLEYLKEKGCRYTKAVYPHPCPLCKDGRTNEIVLEHLLNKAGDLKLNKQMIPQDLEGRIHALDKKCRMFALHKEQLRTQRAEVTKRTEALRPGQAIVIRDFVNHYDHSGGQVKCLIFVVSF